MERPVLMVFEDCHWIDPTSQRALDCDPSRCIERLPVLLVIMQLARGRSRRGISRTSTGWRSSAWRARRVPEW